MNTDNRQIIETDSLFQVDNSFEDDRFMKVRVAVLHSGKNRKASRISTKTIEAAKDTFANIPILANTFEHVDNEGNYFLDYGGHDMHLEQDRYDEGSQRVIYDEKVVGIVPETNNFEIIHDDSTGNDYVFVDALLYREYGNYACDVIEQRGGKVDVSAEINFVETSFSSRDNCIDATKIVMCGITLLGADKTPGMAKAHAQAFSMNDDDRQMQLMTIMQELKESLDNYTKSLKKGGNSTVENTNEIFEEEVIKTEESIAETVIETEAETEAEVMDVEAETETEEEPKVEDEAVEDTPVTEYSMSVSISNGVDNNTFSASLSELQYGFSTLVNDRYADENSYFLVECYLEDKYVIMVDYMTGNAYKQSFKSTKGNYTLVGDRTPVKATYVTEEEQKKLDEMRANYSLIEEKLQKYESEPEKIAVLESEEYALIKSNEEFTELSKRENYFDLTVDEVKAKADNILLNAAKSGNVNFSTEEAPEAPVQKKHFSFVPLIKAGNKPAKRYGNLI